MVYLTFRLSTYLPMGFSWILSRLCRGARSRGEMPNIHASQTPVPPSTLKSDLGARFEFSGMVCVSHMVQVVLTRRPNFSRKKGNASSSARCMAVALTPFVPFEALTLGFSSMGDARLSFLTTPSRFHLLRVPPTTVCQVSARKHSR